MKLLIVGLLLSSFSTFANSLESAAFDAAYEMELGSPTSDEKTEKILRALNVQLTEKSIECTKTTGGTGPADVKNIFTALVASPQLYTRTLTIDQSSPSPTIKVVMIYQTAQEYVYTFEISKDMRSILKVNMVINSTYEGENNTGTLVEPKFEQTLIRTPSHTASCEIL